MPCVKVEIGGVNIVVGGVSFEWCACIVHVACKYSLVVSQQTTI